MFKNDSLLFHIKPFSKRFILALFFMLLVAIFTGLFAIIIQPVMDELFIQGGGKIPAGTGNHIREFIINTFNISHDKMIVFLPVFLFISFLGQAIFTFLYLYFMKTLGLKVVRDIRLKLYKKLIHQSIDFLSKSRTGDLVSRISNDIDKIRYAVSETLSVYIKETLTLIILLFVIFYQDWYMAMISFLIIPVAAFILKRFGKKVQERVLQSQQAIGELSNFLSETVGGNKIVKAYNMEDYEIKKFEELNQKHYRINSKIELIYSFTSPVMHIIGGIVASTIFTIGMHRVSAGIITAGQFTSFLASLFLFYDPLKRLSRANNDYKQGIAGYERVMQIIRMPIKIEDGENSVELKNVRGDVEFKNVYFSYYKNDGKRGYILNNISFKAYKGEMIALVGASGSGKTTMMNLLLRFYEPEKGVIKVDNIDIRKIKLKSLRDSIALVTQDVFLFNDTIFNNIAYSPVKYSFDEVKRAARIARASDFIEELPNGYDTVVGERGILLSNGQRQRISIARAILKNPAILIFDEATSSLDSESEKLIQEAMKEIIKNRTTFVIAHRLSTIIEADNILVIEKGKIVEKGNHKELLKKRGLYYSLYNLQFPDMNIIM